MRSLSAIFVAVALTACAGGARQSETAAFDLGGATVAWRPAAPPLRGVGVYAPSWLGGTAIHYRLLDADPLRRRAYAESRWVAPPAELIERALNRQAPAGGGGCRLRLDIDELAQVFESPQKSRLLLDVRASLVAPHRDAVLARKAFALAQAAPSADARGGVAATAAAVQALGGELAAWLTQTAQDTPGIAARCRDG